MTSRDQSPPNDWRIAAGDLTLSGNDRGEITSLVAGGVELLGSPGSLLALDGEPLGFWLTGVEGAANDIVTMRGDVPSLGVEVVLGIEAFPDSGVVVISPAVTNTSSQPVAVGAISALHLPLAASPDAHLARLRGGQWDHGIPPEGYRLERERMSEVRDRSWQVGSDGRSTGEWLPWYAVLHQDAGFMASLVWSGRWAARATKRGGRVPVSMGISDFTHVLDTGGSLPLPAIVICGFAGDLDEGANRWRSWLADAWCPPVPENWPWVQYNHWYAYYGDIDAGRLLAEGAYAADLGCEVFVIDDGWFMGREKDSYVRGWGDWREDPAKFPDGIRAFSDRIHQLGMKFGIWMEPERIDHDGALAKAHPDWIARRDGDPISRSGRDLEGYHLCLGNPDVQRWMVETVCRVVDDYGVDWLKWDYNIGYREGCNDATHGHQAGDGHAAHTRGLWDVLQQVRERCPDLVIENCASGGMRIDLGTMRFAHTNWISDYTHAAASCRQHTSGAGLFMPLHQCNTWVLHERSVPEFRSRYGGAFGVSSHMGTWSPEEREAFAGAVVEYKRLRPMLSGKRYLLTGPTTSPWDVHQYVSTNGERMAVVAFRAGTAVRTAVVDLRDVDASASYRVEAGGEPEIRIVAGRDLIAAGLAISIPADPGSAIIWIERV